MRLSFIIFDFSFSQVHQRRKQEKKIEKKITKDTYMFSLSWLLITKHAIHQTEKYMINLFFII